MPEVLRRACSHGQNVGPFLLLHFHQKIRDKLKISKEEIQRTMHFYFEITPSIRTQYFLKGIYRKTNFYFEFMPSVSALNLLSKKSLCPHMFFRSTSRQLCSGEVLLERSFLVFQRISL